MGEHQILWFKAMRKKLGVETDDEVRAYMKEVGARAKRHHVGGFHKLKQDNPEKLSEVSRAAANKRWAKDEG